MSMADGIVVNSSGVPQKLLEIECPVKGKLNKSCLPPACDWLCKETGHSSLKRKHTYYGQVQLGMAILNGKVAILLSIRRSQNHLQP
jgi:hypothetical protein